MSSRLHNPSANEDLHPSEEVAAVIVVFLLVTNVERWRVGRYFWNQRGLEYTVMWTIAAFYILARGGGLYSLDRVFGWDF